MKPIGTLPRCLSAPALVLLMLSAATSAAPDASRPTVFGSGNFGSWTLDRWGLPAYDYALDERVDPRARILEADGDTAAWHQLGNDRLTANAYNHGYVQVWSQDRDYQWVNKFDEAARQYSGGYGYLRVGGRTISTLSMDRGKQFVQRRFGVGYFRRAAAYDAVAVEEYVYAPYGDATFLHHDVIVENRSAAPVDVVWWEYWGVNPVAKLSPFRVEGPGAGTRIKGNLFDGLPRELGPVRYDAALKTLSVEQLPIDGDAEPLTIFAAALDTPVAGVATSTEGFFGSGTRAAPQAVERDGVAEMPSAQEAQGRSKTLFAMRSPVSLAPWQKVRLRYVYGYAHRESLPKIVKHAAAVQDPLEVSEQQWKRWLPQADFGPAHRWLERELAWAGYLLRSSTVYEESAGRHIITEGGWYQYGLGLQLAFRDPLQTVLPIIYADPWLAREVLIYSAQQQLSTDGTTPFAIARLGASVPTLSSDNDLWLLLAVSEYVFATRDAAILDTQVRWRDGGSASLWDHLKLAYRHQESFANGAHGLYGGAKWGDWADAIVERAGLTETTLVTAQLAYIYPRLADLAERRGDDSFAKLARERAEVLKALTAREWTERGWLSRGYAGDRQLGSGVIYGEPQPWGLLSGALDAQRATQLIKNVRRYLTGVGAPSQLNGPSKIGSTQSPALNDPDIDEVGVGTYRTLGENSAVWLGGAWFAVNGWLTWALGSVDAIVPNARDYAWDELKRNTLAAHASAFPDHWHGIISVDDFCYGWYSPREPQRCGNAELLKKTRYYGQNTHQPTWLMFNAIKLAGFNPSADGYTIEPHIPLEEFSLRLPTLGLHLHGHGADGYFRLEDDAALKVRLKKVAAWANETRATVRVDGRPVPHEEVDGYIAFTLPTTPVGQERRWVISFGAGAAAQALDRAESTSGRHQ